MRVIIRGKKGGERVQIGLKDARTAADDDAILVDLPALDVDWKTFEIPLSDFKGLRTSEIASLVLLPLSPGKGEFSVRSVVLSDAPAKPTSRIIEFSNRTWEVKRGTSSPGPNRFSDAADALWVDDQGLHMRVFKQKEETGKDAWYCTEVSTVCDGYAEYRFVIFVPNELPPELVLGCFGYQSDTEEFDGELSKWGDPHNKNSQFCLQPAADDCIHRFDTGAAKELTVSLRWADSELRGRCWESHDATGKKLADWTCNGDGGKLPRHDKERIHVNFWLFRGQAPTPNDAQELVIKSFAAIPLADVGSPLRT